MSGTFEQTLPRSIRGDAAMAAGDITFIQCPQGDSFPVQKTASRSSGAQQVVCPRCGRSFEVKLEETVERPSARLGFRVAVTRFA